MSKYLIQVLDSKAFDSLNYKHVGEAIGVTDTNEKKIFIRNMGNTAINHDILEHEIDEASNNFYGHESPDEVGIKYGWFKKLTGISTPKFIKQSGAHIGSWAPQTAGAILTAIGLPQIGIPLATAGGGVHSYQSDKSLGSVATGAAIGGLTAYGGGAALGGGIKGATAAAPGLLSKAGGAVAGAGAGLGLPGFGAGGAASGFLTGAKAGAAGAGAGAAGTGSVLLPGSPAAAAGGNLPGIASSTGYTAGGIGAGPGLSAGLPSAGQTAAGALAKTSWPKTLAGFALPMAASALTPTPEMPESGEVNRLKGMMDESGAISPVGSLGLEKLTERLGTGWEGLSDEYKNTIKSDFAQPYEDAKKNLMNQYKQLRPGADIENDSAFRKDFARLEQEFADRIGDRTVQAEQEERTNYLNRQAQDIQTSLGLDQQTFQRYTEMAQYDVDKLMTQFGLDYQSATDFKSIFGQYGSLLMQQGLGL